MDMGTGGIRVYAGRFTLVKSDLFLETPPSIASTCQLDFLTSNERDTGGGVCLNSENLSTYIQGICEINYHQTGLLPISNYHEERDTPYQKKCIRHS